MWRHSAASSKGINCLVNEVNQTFNCRSAQQWVIAVAITHHFIHFIWFNLFIESISSIISGSEVNYIHWTKRERNDWKWNEMITSITHSANSFNARTNEANAGMSECIKWLRQWRSEWTNNERNVMEWIGCEWSYRGGRHSRNQFFSFFPFTPIIVCCSLPALSQFGIEWISLLAWAANQFNHFRNWRIALACIPFIAQHNFKSYWPWM